MAALLLAGADAECGGSYSSGSYSSDCAAECQTYLEVTADKSACYSTKSKVPTGTDDICSPDCADILDTMATKCRGYDIIWGGIDWSAKDVNSALDGLDGSLAACPRFKTDCGTDAKNCVSIKQCAGDEYISQEATEFSQRVCSKVSECGVDQAELTAPTATSNRACAPIDEVCGAALTAAAADMCVTIDQQSSNLLQTAATCTDKCSTLWETATAKCAGATREQELTAVKQACEVDNAANQACDAEVATAVKAECYAPGDSETPPSATASFLRKLEETSSPDTTTTITESPAGSTDQTCTASCLPIIDSVSDKCVGSKGTQHRQAVSALKTSCVDSVCDDAKKAANSLACYKENDDGSFTENETTCTEPCLASVRNINSQCQSASYFKDMVQPVVAQFTAFCKQTVYKEKCEADEANCKETTKCNAETQFTSKEATDISDRECAALTVCSEAEYETKAATPASNRECAALAVCSTGEYESKPPTKTANRVCATVKLCQTGEYQKSAATATTNAVCTAVRDCNPDTQFEKAKPSATSDRECQDYKVCTADLQFEVGFESPGGDKKCAALTTCAADTEYESKAPTSNSDRVCSPLTTCTLGQFYQSVAPTTTTNRVCKAVSTCDYSTQFRQTAATTTEDVGCESLTAKCVAGTHYESKPATRTSDRMCTALTTCKLGETYETGISATGDRVCAQVDKCTGTGQYTRLEATLTRNAVCATEVQCDNTIQDADGTGAAKVCKMRLISNPVGSSRRRLAAEVTCDQDSECTETNMCDTVAKKCQFYNFCPAGQYVSSGNVHDKDSTIECKAVTTCSASEYQTAAATATSDTGCQALKTCDAFAATPEYESKAPTPGTDRECASVTDCNANEFLSAKFTATANNVCDPYTKCDVATQYVSEFPTPTEDLKCTSLTTCSSTQYQTAAAATGTVKGNNMNTADRQCTTKTTCPSTQYDAQTDNAKNAECTALKVCTSSEYQSKAATTTTDRTCSALSQCASSTQFEKVAPTATTNRECETATVCYDATSSAAQTKYYTAYHTGNSNAVCANVTDCSSASYMIDPPTAATNRKCASRRACAAGTEYISNSEADGYNAANSVVDNTCAALTVCDSAKDLYENVAPTATSDRTCGSSKAPTPAPTPVPTPAPTPAPTEIPETREKFGTLQGSITLTGLTGTLAIEAVGWKKAIADVLNVTEASVQNVKVDQEEATKAETLRRALAANDVKVTYEVAVYDQAELATVQKSMSDFNSGGDGSFTKLQAALEAVSTGAKAQLANVKMTATTEKVTCSTCAGSDDLTDGEIAAIVIGVLVGVALIVAAVMFSMGKGDTHPEPAYNGNNGGASDSTEVQPATGYSYNTEV
jgi:hypothetical protein